MKQFKVENSIKVDGLNIHYKLIGPDSHPRKSNFVVALGNPPFTLNFYAGKTDDFYKTNEDANVNFIFIDYPGCGKSDASSTPEHYTVDFYTKAVAVVIAHIRKEQSIAKMKLIVQGPSMGSLVAMNLIAQNPDWTKEDADIALDMIVNVNPVIANKTRIPYIIEKNAEDRKLNDYVAAQRKLEEGAVKNTSDFIVNIQSVLAPLTANFSFFEKLMVSSLRIFPNAVPRVIKFLQETFPNNLTLAFINEALHFSVDVANSFAGLKTNTFDLEKVISENYDAFKKPLIVNIIDPDNRYESHSSDSAKIKALLKDNVAEIVMPASLSFFDKVKMLVSQMSKVYSGTFTIDASATFLNKLKELNKKLRSAIKPTLTSTSNAFATLGCPKALEVENSKERTLQSTSAVQNNQNMCVEELKTKEELSVRQATPSLR